MFSLWVTQGTVVTFDSTALFLESETAYKIQAVNFDFIQLLKGFLACARDTHYFRSSPSLF